MMAYLQNTNEYCQAAVENMHHSHDENEYMELVKTFSWYNLHISLQPTTKRCGSSPHVLKLDCEFLALSYRTHTGQWPTQECDYSNRYSCLFSSWFWSKTTLSSWSPLNELLQKLEPLWGQPRCREKLCITHRSPFQVGKPSSVSPVSDSSYALELWTCDYEVKSEGVNLQESLKNM